VSRLGGHRGNHCFALLVPGTHYHVDRRLGPSLKLGHDYGGSVPSDGSPALRASLRRFRACNGCRTQAHSGWQLHISQPDSVLPNFMLKPEGTAGILEENGCDLPGGVL
jgi:hypothetical protein